MTSVTSGLLTGIQERCQHELDTVGSKLLRLSLIAKFLQLTPARQHQGGQASCHCCHSCHFCHCCHSFHSCHCCHSGQNWDKKCFLLPDGGVTGGCSRTLPLLKMYICQWRNVAQDSHLDKISPSSQMFTWTKMFLETEGQVKKRTILLFFVVQYFAAELF